MVSVFFCCCVLLSGSGFFYSPDEPILSFQRNAFFSLKDERKLLDPKLNAAKGVDLLFHEVSTLSCVLP